MIRPTADDEGDLLFATSKLGTLRLTRPLPDLRRFGWSKEKRAAWYAPEPNRWRREEVRGVTGDVIAIRLYVPRRYQWFARVVLGVPFADLLTEEP